MNKPVNYVLIDFENVQPKNLELLSKHPFRILVFVGASQTKVSYELAEAMQRLGENARYIKIEGNGRNALDFHIPALSASCPPKIPRRGSTSFQETPASTRSLNTSNPAKSMCCAKRIWPKSRCCAFPPLPATTRK